MFLENMPHGDMPGDTIRIQEEYIPPVEKLLASVEPYFKPGRMVITISGGSGSGKSTQASILSWLLAKKGIRSYIMSGDNYPHRVPRLNDACRLQTYQEGGREALNAYLGTDQEIDYERVNEIIEAFKNGAQTIEMRRLGTEPEDRVEEPIDFSEIDLLILEWTHANSPFVKGSDLSIFLQSTPEATLARRLARGRNANAGDPFIAMVLELEQAKLDKQAENVMFTADETGSVVCHEEKLNG